MHYENMHALIYVVDSVNRDDIFIAQEQLQKLVICNDVDMVSVETVNHPLNSIAPSRQIA